MENNDFFTQEEHKQLILLYKRLLRLSKDTLQKDDCHKLKTHLVKAMAEGTIPRNVFQMNPIIKDMQTAVIVAEEIGMKRASILGLMLHDSVRCGTCTAEEVERNYGEDVAGIIRGLIRVNELYAKSPTIESENFRNLLISFAEDIRVQLIFLAEKLYALRQAAQLSEAGQKQLAMETSYIYIPFAHRLGLYNIKSEMEDTALRYANPQIYREIEQKLKESKTAREAYIAEFIAPIAEEMNRRGIKFKMKYRTKTIASILNKMRKSQVEFEEIFDIFAVRFIIDSVGENEKPDCWRVYSIVTDKYTPNPQRLRDWISVPKSNGYESLQTTVLGPGKRWVEVQIRTERMDEIAEKGLAAHWKYKNEGESSELDKWLAGIKEILDQPDASALEFLDEFKLNLFASYGT